MNKKLLSFAFLLIVTVFSFGVSHAQAATGDLYGWAWSSNFGWISLNSDNPCSSSDCPSGMGGPYAVNIDSSGNWSGWAWSQYLGWISFNVSDVASNCGGSISPPGGKLVSSATGEVTGGAYAMVYASTLIPQSGCIEFSGANHTSPSLAGGGGVTYNPGSSRFVGYAWGGDTTTDTGPGWIQFNASYTPTSTGGGTITATCNATTPYTNLSPGALVTMKASGTSGTGPYQYSWNGGPFTSTDTYTAAYSTTMTPTVTVRDSVSATGNPTCPTVTVIMPVGTGDLRIGKTVSSATLISLTAKQNSPFALKWSFTTHDTYSCTPSVSPDPASANWNTNWKAISLNPANSNGRTTWSGDTGTTLTAGTTLAPIPVGVYNFIINCTSPTPGMLPQSASAILKVTSSNVIEI